MFTIIIQRLGIGIITVLAVSVVFFVMMLQLPFDAAQVQLGQNATPETLAALRAEMGLDQPYYMQYLNWLSGFVRGELGVTLSNQNITLEELIAVRYENTIYVAALTAIIGVPVSVALGVMAAMFPRTLYDRIVSFFCALFVSAPDFFTATVLVIIFVKIFGIGSTIVVGSLDGKNFFDLIVHFAFPIGTLCIVIASQLIRMSRAAVLNVMSSPYIEMAILKGVPRRRIILRHALFNAFGPIVNVVALNLAYSMTGVIIIENYFSYQGLATLIIQGVQQGDSVSVMGIGMMICAAYVVLMMVADLAQTLSNPRLRYPK